VRGAAVLLAVAAAAMYVLLAGSPLIRGIPALPGAIAVTALFIVATLLVAAAAARVSMSWPTELLGTLLGLVLWWVLAGLGENNATLRLVTVPAADVIFLVACVLAGRLLSRIITERNLLLPVALVLALADVFTVFIGPTGQALEKMPELVANLSIKVPQVGSAAGPEGAAGLTHMATMGPGDLVFAALFFAAVVRFGLSLRASFIGITVPVVIGLVGFLLLPLLPGVPVLPLMALGFLIANRGRFRLSRQEKIFVLIAAVVVALLLAGLWLAMRALLPEAPEEEQVGQGRAVLTAGPADRSRGPQQEPPDHRPAAGPKGRMIRGPWARPSRSGATAPDSGQGTALVWAVGGSRQTSVGPPEP